MAAGKGLSGLAIIMGKGKPKDDGQEEAPEPSEEGAGGDEDEFLKAAHEALKNDDQESFVRSMKGAIRDCIDKEMKGGY